MKSETRKEWLKKVEDRDVWKKQEEGMIPTIRSFIN